MTESAFLASPQPLSRASRKAIQFQDGVVVVLALTVGAVDAVGYLLPGKVFGSNIPVNLVLLGLSAGQRSNGALLAFVARAVLGGLAALRVPLAVPAAVVAPPAVVVVCSLPAAIKTARWSRPLRPIFSPRVRPVLTRARNPVIIPPAGSTPKAVARKASPSCMPGLADWRLAGRVPVRSDASTFGPGRRRCQGGGGRECADH